jgi:hypothetical protein
MMDIIRSLPTMTVLGAQHGQSNPFSHRSQLKISGHSDGLGGASSK